MTDYVAGLKAFTVDYDVDNEIVDTAGRKLQYSASGSLAIERLSAFLSTAFGFLATLLAFLGLYGVTAFGVTRRSAEIGLRMALGAQGRSVVGMVLKEVAILAGLGVALALPLAWWLSELVESQLYGVAPRDPLTLALATLALVAVALGAGAIPALRASWVSPTSVLRYE